MKMIKKHKWLLISLVITLAILSVIFALKGQYPFGRNVFSNVDFDPAYVPMYYKLWDVMHGIGSIFIDWNLGAGLNTYGAFVMNGMIYPTSLLIGLFNRDFIPYAMNIILMIKILNMNIFAYIAIDKLFPKLEGYYKSMLSLFYTFSGWTLLMIGSIIYLDAASLFPLFVFAYYNFVKNDKWVLYMVILTSVLTISFYQAWMYLLFTIGITTISFITQDIKNKKKKIVQLALMSGTSLMISSAFVLPAFYQSITSIRIGNLDTDLGYSALHTFLNKVSYILPLGILFILSFKQLLVKKDKKINLLFGLILFYTLIGIFIEPINLMWHAGSYMNLPLRYGYIPTFMLILTSGYYLTYNYSNKSKFVLATFISTIISIIIFIVLVLLFKNEMNKGHIALNMYTYAQPIGMMLLFIISMVITFMLFSNSKKGFKYLLLSFSIISIFSFSYMYIVVAEQHTSLNAQEIKDNFKLINDGYNYVNYNVDDIYFNYPCILMVPSMENWLHFIKKEETTFRETFNYFGETYPYVGSTGGNLLSNYIMMNKYYLTKDEILDNKLYKEIGNYKDIHYYESIYNGEYIISYNGKIYNEQTNFVEDTNNVFKTIFDKDYDIIKKIKIDHTGDNIKFNLKKGNIYYLEYVFYEIDPFVKYLYNNDNVNIIYGFLLSPSSSTATICFTVNNDVDVKLKYKDYKENEVLLSYINIDKFINFVSNVEKNDVTIKTEKNKRVYNITLNEDKSVLVPINYDDAFKVYVNGKETNYKKNIYNMFSIDLKKGENEIEFVYYPKFLKEGIVLTLVSMLLLITVLILNKKIHFLDYILIINPIFFIACFGGMIFIIKIYILSWLEVFL